MEDRLDPPHLERPGAALIALAAILAITAAWWALALWPLGNLPPEWLVRTRAACFGAAPGGLPNAGGWILLIGEPVGMLGALVVGFGRPLRAQLHWLGARPGGRLASGAMLAVLLFGLGALTQRVSRALPALRAASVAPLAVPQRLDRPAPADTLVDQYGTLRTLRNLPVRPALLTFAYGHCTTVCPITVHDLLVARRTAGRPEVPIVVMTLDPWRDTPDRLPTMAAGWGLAPGDLVLSGPAPAVERALDALGIGRQRNGTTGDIVHGATAMVLDADGRIAWRVNGEPAGAWRLLRP